jgi:hypothetical protein
VDIARLSLSGYRDANSGAMGLSSCRTAPEQVRRSRALKQVFLEKSRFHVRMRSQSSAKGAGNCRSLGAALIHDHRQQIMQNQSTIYSSKAHYSIAMRFGNAILLVALAIALAAYAFDVAL